MKDRVCTSCGTKLPSRCRSRRRQVIQNTQIEAKDPMEEVRRLSALVKQLHAARTRSPNGSIRVDRDVGKARSALQTCGFFATSRVLAHFLPMKRESKAKNCSSRVAHHQMKLRTPSWCSLTKSLITSVDANVSPSTRKLHCCSTTKRRRTWQRCTITTRTTDGTLRAWLTAFTAAVGFRSHFGSSHFGSSNFLLRRYA